MGGKSRSRFVAVPDEDVLTLRDYLNAEGAMALANKMLGEYKTANVAISSFSLLWWVVAKGDLEAARWVIDQGATPANWKRDKLVPELHACNATKTNSCELARLLIEQGWPVDSQNIDNVTPIMDAVYGFNRELALCLAELGADLQPVDKFGRTVESLCSQCDIPFAELQAAGRK